MYMPRSKHWRKPGGKSVKHPGRGKPGFELPMTASEAALPKFTDAFCRPFHQQWRERDERVSYMLDLVAEAIFDPDSVTFLTFNENAVLPTFLAPFEEEDGSSVTWTLEDADAALSVLARQEMVVIDGDLISIHPRFAGVMDDPLTQADANGSQGLT
jgi:hypothetical protein